jgi:hypothetical protein
MISLATFRVNSGTERIFMHRCLLFVFLLTLVGPHNTLSAQGVKPPNADEMQAEGFDAAAANEEIPMPNAADRAPIKIVPGQNLFGETIDNNIEKKAEIGPSQMVTRVLSLLEVSLEKNKKVAMIESSYKETAVQLAEKSTQLQQLPNRYQATIGKYAELEEKRNAMVPFLAVAQGKQNNAPAMKFVQDYNGLKVVINGLISEIQLMEQQQKSLPIEIQNLRIQANQIAQSQAVVGQEIFEIVTSWSELLSVLRFIPQSDAEDIASACQIKLDAYPEAHLIRMMKAFAALQLLKTEAAIVDLKKVMQSPGVSNDNLARVIQLRCQVGIAWACLLQDDLDGAGIALGAARKLNGRDYETAVLIAHLTDLRGKSSSAFSLYKNATSIAPKRPEAYRFAADMTIKSGIRDPGIALQLAKMACKNDQDSDFRNTLSLARVHHACGDEQSRDEAIAKAYEQAGESGKSFIKKCEDEFLATAK